MINPYRRAFLVTTLNEIQNDERALIKYLSESFPELLKNLTDVSTSTIMQGLGHKKFKHLFEPKPDKKSDKGKIMVAPGGQVVRIRPNYKAHL